MTQLATVDLGAYRLGTPQSSGTLTVVPVFGQAYPGIVPPQSGVKLSHVDGYGTVVLRNPGSDGVAIVPLHMGYVQDGAQNHALCRSAFLAAGQELRFTDACCVQASQGGYLAGRDQWFFVLPLELRTAALESRGTANYSKLWPAISRLNLHYGLPARGHLEQVLTGKRGVLTQYRSRLELVAGQLGALFFVGGRLAGLEIAPDPGYFAEVWAALVCFAYGPAAWNLDRTAAPSTVEPYRVSTVDELAAAVTRSRSATVERVGGWLAEADWRPETVTEEDAYLDLRLSTVAGERVAGQVVTEHGRLVYASLFARSAEIG